MSRQDDMNDPALLWRTGSFICELRSGADPAAFLCILRDGESLLEVTVLSTIEAEERAQSLRSLVERCVVHSAEGGVARE
jgi:hypothetical protein